jgi:hypothetical protein
MNKRSGAGTAANARATKHNNTKHQTHHVTKKQENQKTGERSSP